MIENGNNIWSHLKLLSKNWLLVLSVLANKAVILLQTVVLHPTNAYNLLIIIKVTLLGIEPD